MKPTPTPSQEPASASRPQAEKCQEAHAGSVSIVFCLRRSGHSGDHRGKGRQWGRDGERKAITIRLDADGWPIEPKERRP